MSASGQGTPLLSAMPNRLVIAGPYRVVRNPMAVAGIAQGVAVGLILSSWRGVVYVVVIYAIVGSLLWNYAVRPREETDLEEGFGEQFWRYRETVRCWRPRGADSHSSSTRFPPGADSHSSSTRFPRGAGSR